MWPWWVTIITGIVCLLGGFVIGFFVIKKVFTAQLEKNPPITREQVKMMYQQFGRKPTEKDINKVMATMNPKKDK